MTAMDAVQDEDLEDLRFAVVMNGGVSLAIWIGGVTYELNRLTQRTTGEPNAYDAVLDIVKSTARVDVISGTSAGGLNGAFLALATAYDSSLEPLGRLWAERGGLRDLLRGPLTSQPPSLLQGDEYFLPKLREAFGEIRGGGRYVEPHDAPIDLTITTSLMDGRLTSSVDDFGTAVVEMDHRARFHFARDASTAVDPFRDPAIVEKLALAARSTASFPFAFEPSFVPIGELGPDPDHPDMSPNPDFPGNRFVLDGGVLLNKPVGPALEAIFRQPAQRQVRRILVYVNPDPGAPVQPRANDHNEPYGLSRVMTDSLMTLPRAQSITQDLADLREHNRRVRDEKQMRPNLLAELGDNVDALARTMFPTYQRVRTRLVVNRIIDGADPRRTGSATPRWTREDLVAAFEPEPPDERPMLRFVPHHCELPPGDAWDWGIEPVERLGWVALDLLRSAILAAPLVGPDADSALRGDLREARVRVHAVLARLRALRAAEDKYWDGVAARLPEPPADAHIRDDQLRAWAVSVAEAWPGTASAAPVFTGAQLRGEANLLLEALVGIAPRLRHAADLGISSGEPLVQRHGEELKKTLETLLPLSPETADGLVQRLLSVEVCYVALTGGFPPGGNDVLLMQVDGRTPNGFGDHPTLENKLAGVQLGHFGAFYKKSWRVNDWLWGRLDGATRLVEAVLGTSRLRQLGYRRDTLLPVLRSAAVGAPEEPYLVDYWDKHEARIHDELSFLDHLDLPVPPSAPVTARVLARRLHLDALHDELERLASAVRADVAKGAARSGPGPTFADNYDEATKAGPLRSEQLVTLFADAHIGEERISREVGTDLLAATASTAAAVAVASLDMPKVKLGPVRIVLRALRAVTLTLYALIYGSVEGSRIGAAAVNLALCAGGALLAVSLLSDAPSILTAIAAVIIIAGLASAALRSRMWLLALAFGVPLVVLTVGAIAGGAWAEVREHGEMIGVVGGLIVATALLGSVRMPARPLAEVRGRTGIVLQVFLTSVLLVAAVFLVVQDRSPGRIVELELAGTVTRAADVLMSWENRGLLDRAADTVVFDFLFLAAYWIPLSMLAAMVAWGCRRLNWPRWWTVGAVLSWFALYAAILDAVENVLLLIQIDQVRDQGAAPTDPVLPAVTAALAGLKFLIIGAILLYVVPVGARVLLGRPWRPRVVAPVEAVTPPTATAVPLGAGA